MRSTQFLWISFLSYAGAIPLLQDGAGLSRDVDEPVRGLAIGIANTPLSQCPRSVLTYSPGGLNPPARHVQNAAIVNGHAFEGLAPETIPLQPAHKLRAIVPKSISKATKHVGAHMGGKRGMRHPRPESSVTDLGSPESTTSQAAPSAHSDSTTQSSAQSPRTSEPPKPARPESSVQSLGPAQKSPAQPVAPSVPIVQHHAPPSNVPRPQSSVTDLGSPEPTTAQVAPPVLPAQPSAQSNGAGGGSRIPRPESSVKSIGPAQASPVQPVTPPESVKQYHKAPPSNVPRPQSSVTDLGPSEPTTPQASPPAPPESAKQPQKPYSNLPRPQSSVTGLGSPEPTTPQAVPPPPPESVKEYHAPPSNVPRPQSSVTSLGAPEPTAPQSAPPAQSSAQLDGSGGGSRIPRPESSVKSIGPANPSPIQSDSPPGSPKQYHAPPSNVPRPQSSVTSLGPVESIPYQPAPIKTPSNPIQEPSAYPSPKPVPPPSPTPVQISTTPPAIITIGSSTITADSSSRLKIGSQTLAPGSAITHSGTEYSLLPSGSGVVIGPSTQTIAPAASPSAPVITVGSSTLTANSASQFHIGSQTLAPGSVITTNGQTISLAPSASAIVINSHTQAITPQALPASPVITLAGSTYTGNSASEFQIGSQTLKAGGPAITNAAGQVYSLAPSASALVINGQTTSITPGHATPAPVITLGRSQITANAASQYVIGGQTLSAGSSITLSHRILSLAPGGSALVFGASTQSLSAPRGAFTLTQQQQPPILTLNKEGGHQTLVTAASNSEYVIAHQTLRPGGPAITLDHGSSTLSLFPSATALLINGHVTTLPTPSKILASLAPPLITLGPSTVLTPNQHSIYTIAGETLSPGGPAITVHGTRLSLDQSDHLLFVGSSTESLSSRVVGYRIRGNETSSATRTGSASSTFIPSFVLAQPTNSPTAAAAAAVKKSAATNLRGRGRGNWLYWISGLMAGMILMI